MKKCLMSGFLCLIMSFVFFASFASANSYWYTIDSPNSNGPTKLLTAANKEYAQVSVNTEGGKSVTVSLYNYNLFGSIWYGDDQSLTYGSGRRAWWYGDTTTNRNYFIKGTTTASTMNLAGYFQNFQ